MFLRLLNVSIYWMGSSDMKRRRHRVIIGIFFSPPLWHLEKSMFNASANRWNVEEKKNHQSFLRPSDQFHHRRRKKERKNSTNTISKDSDVISHFSPLRLRNMKLNTCTRKYNNYRGEDKAGKIISFVSVRLMYFHT